MKSPFHLSRRWVLWLLGCLLLALSVVTLVGERGAFHLLRLRQQKMALDEQNFRLQKENEVLRQQILRIRRDNDYLEKLAREELNMVRPGEIIYRSARSARPNGGLTLSEPPARSRPSMAQTGPR
ncbi:MAG TPA: septum formation initiator family protein [Terriglobales bacterium]|nr:septum formation initiator family protein [Terriglobales bacterium]